MLIKGNNICDRISENRQYTHNSTFVIKRIQKLWVKNAMGKLQKKIHASFYCLTGGRIKPPMDRSWTSSSLFHLHTRKDIKVTDVCLRCGDERIYRQSFISEFAFLLEHRSMPGAKLYLGG